MDGEGEFFNDGIGDGLHQFFGDESHEFGEGGLGVHVDEEYPLLSLCQVVAQVLGEGGFGDSPGLVEEGDGAGCLGIHQARLGDSARKLARKIGSFFSESKYNEVEIVSRWLQRC